MNWPRPIRVVGVGSPMGDDAVAWKVIGELEQMTEPMPEVEFHRVDGGQRLLDLLDGQGSLVMIDALATGASVGEIVNFTWPDERVESMRPGSTHDFGPAAALRLAEALGTLPKCIKVYCIVAACFEPRNELSLQVAGSVSELACRLVVELASACER